jgi:hypothetical protein
MPAERVKRWFFLGGEEKTGHDDDDDDEYHGINIEEGGRKRVEEKRAVEETKVKWESWRNRHKVVPGPMRCCLVVPQWQPK